MVSTTSVPPSQCPTEYPSQLGSGSLGSGLPSVQISRQICCSSKNIKTLPGICTISHGLGRTKTCGGPLGSQRRAELSSLPATAFSPDKGFAASTCACPQGVNGGLKCSFTPFIPGVPGTSPSRYCIQTPDRSCERGAALS